MAKDLKLNDIPVYVKETANTSTEQVSANMFNIPMTLLEASDVIANLMEENPDYTRKNIADLFGRKVDWVDKAISLTNLSPEIRKVVKDPVKVMDDLVKISAFSLELQKKAFEFSDLDENEEGVAWEQCGEPLKLSPQIDVEPRAMYESCVAELEWKRACQAALSPPNNENEFETNLSTNCALQESDCQDSVWMFLFPCECAALSHTCRKSWNNVDAIGRSVARA